MKKRIQTKHLILAALFLATRNTSSVTAVYSMKIRRTFSEQDFSKLLAGTSYTQKKSILIGTALPLFYVRKRHFDVPSLNQNVYEKTLFGETLFNLRLLFPQTGWWTELTTGFGKQASTYKGTHNFKASRAGMDDILIHLGKNIFFNDYRCQGVIYALAGFPTETKITTEQSFDPLVGSRFFSIGTGGEISYKFDKQTKGSLYAILQARFIHFFDRHWEPVLPANAYIQPGNLIDVFGLLQYSHQADLYETGYNPTFFTNQAALLRSGAIKNNNFVRHSFYVNYLHAYRESFILKHPGAVGTGLSASWSKMLDTKIFAFWFNLSILF